MRIVRQEHWDYAEVGIFAYWVVAQDLGERSKEPKFVGRIVLSTGALRLNLVEIAQVDGDFLGARRGLPLG